MGFTTSWPKIGVWGQNRGRCGAILTPNEPFFLFGGSYVCANFGENRSRNATLRVPTDGQIHTLTHTDFIICPMLYAIAMGQIATMNLITKISLTLGRQNNDQSILSHASLFERRCSFDPEHNSHEQT